MRIWPAVVVVAGLSFPTLAQETVATLTGVATVKDGDGLLFGEVEVRLQGIAAPELDDPMGAESRDGLKLLADGKEVVCQLDGTTAGRSGRPVGVCYVDGQDIGQAQIEAGLARDCQRYSLGRYRESEAAARAAGHNLSSKYPLPGYCKPSREQRREIFEKLLAEARLAAEQGDIEMQHALGQLYSNGNGVEQDYGEAARWYDLAAKQGHATAQIELGDLYTRGDGVPQDYVEAMRLYRLAASQGDPSAQLKLGHIFATGQGIPQEVVSAYMWFAIAAETKPWPAARRRDGIAERMTVAEVSEAERRAGQCIASNYTDCD